MIQFGTFLMIISFLCTIVSIVIVASNHLSYTAWVKGILIYVLGWALLLVGGFITGRYSLGYIIKFFKNKNKR